MRKILTMLIALIAMTPAYAADDKAVNGTYTYYGHQGMTMAEARERALAGAQTEALREAFGTLVTQDVMESNEIQNNREMQNFLSSTQSTVRGEWLTTTGTPTYQESFENGCPVVTCSVSGRGRKLSNKAPEIIAKVLNAPDKRAVTSDLLEGEDIFMYVNSPSEDVYVMICIESPDGTVQRLFPYISGPLKLAIMKKGYDYILFDRDRPQGDFGEIDAFNMTTLGEMEIDRIYVMYSPNYFRRGPWEHISDQAAETMSVKDFNKWMLELRRGDEEMGMQVINLSVRPNRDLRYEEE